jgi:hypothetical protein
MPYVTDDNLTDVVLERWNDIPDPRLRQIMQSLIKHLHGFVRDVEPTQAEWATGIDWLTHRNRRGIHSECRSRPLTERRSLCPRLYGCYRRLREIPQQVRRRQTILTPR